MCRVEGDIPCRYPCVEAPLFGAKVKLVADGILRCRDVSQCRKEIRVARVTLMEAHGLLYPHIVMNNFCFKSSWASLQDGEPHFFRCAEISPCLCLFVCLCLSWNWERQKFVLVTCVFPFYLCRGEASVRIDWTERGRRVFEMLRNWICHWDGRSRYTGANCALGLCAWDFIGHAGDIAWWGLEVQDATSEIALGIGVIRYMLIINSENPSGRSKTRRVVKLAPECGQGMHTRIQDDCYNSSIN